MLGPAPFFIAGIVNATPDSFYDGGRHDGTDAAYAHGLRLLAEGAHILDVGGESTRPFADHVSEEQELARVLPVVEWLCASREMHAPLAEGFLPAVSVDTYKAGVARRVLEAGVEIINDVSACMFEPELLDVVAQYKPGYVLMHSKGKPGDMQKAPRYDDVVEEVLSFFEERMSALVAAGVPEDRIVLDPGIGFGKLLEHNAALLAGVERLSTLGRPVYMGLSNKSLWQHMLGLGPEERQTATQVATALLAARGVPIHRVHEVALTRQTLTIVRQIGCK